ncbi:NERD domain-containing protein [Rossellomorea vietnamensis]|uniref:NERD domain-containing protein n=1 Tax=Rossellomorea vietnamensis TaxID=218284 RepID=A0A5D4NND1_9BACI|nr:nuclease-related domain-containing protein [Rossellomorea vietnamensis]TYS15430.1 NERD domain-containing protein [Rossellomorea vietnamensis]
MKVKERTESKELRIYRAVHFRKDLPPKEKQFYAGLEKGFIGEKLFDEWLEPVLDNRILLPDMQFMPSTTFVQIDTILLTSKLIYLFEVKNYEGDHILEGENLYRLDGSDTKNPVLQLKRNEPVFRKVLETLGYKIPIKSFAVFVNPQFHLYNAPADLPILYPTQLQRFIQKLKQESSFLKRTHTELAKKLISMTIDENPYSKIPRYEYQELKKGITCAVCGEFYREYGRLILTCNFCKGRENAHDAVVRTIRDFRLLFPDKNLTMSTAIEWCSIVKSAITMHKVLTNNFKLIKPGRTSHYIQKD